MKKTALLLFVVAILAGCTGPRGEYAIKGHVNKIDTGLVFLQKFEADKWVNTDSTRLEKGSFVFKGKVDLPELIHISLPSSQLILPVFVENTAIQIEINPDTVEKSVVTGSPTHDIFKQYQTMTDAINAKMDVVYSDWKAAKEKSDTLGMKRNDSLSTALDAEMKKQLVDFAKTNNKSVVSPYIVLRNSWQFELPELEQIVGSMDTTLNASMYLKSLRERVRVLQSVQVGQPAPDFSMNDSTGKPVQLSSLKGKVLLVDFWASWCSPCRAENPNVVKAWQAYNKKGFDVLGCSFDQNREKWIKAVKDDKLTWTHVSDLKGWGNAAGKLYGVNSIPANVLLDKDQKIIGRNLRGEDLMKKLEEILGPVDKKKK
ncbi:MAG TPA: TlpA disulfide reductase family protein [Bacteroidales bacterium]|nr:TlpA disulfide reductase family protein [Bacteroidales bacterium]HPS61694.1 TlpA disulfide reductase family protein [Bacteroidales bacterium]